MSIEEADIEALSKIERVSEDKPKYDYLFKICLMGNASVGKTSLLTRYSENNFKESYNNTIGVDFRVVTLKIKEKVIKLHIWDTAGQERFKAITCTYLKNCNGFIYVYDISDKDSFSEIPNWMELSKANNNNATFSFLVGNKSDKVDSRQVSTEEGEEFAKKNNFAFFETSAKTEVNVLKVFNYFALKLIRDYEENKEKYEIEDRTSISSGRSVSIGTKREKGGCKC